MYTWKVSSYKFNLLSCECPRHKKEKVCIDSTLQADTSHLGISSIQFKTIKNRAQY